MDPQAKFLRRRAIQRKEAETCCDCPGGNVCPARTDQYLGCKGFVRNCTCDNDWEGLRNARR